MQTTDEYEAKVRALVDAFRDKERKDKLDLAVLASLDLQIAADAAHSALTVEDRARRRAAEAYLIARGAVAVISMRWVYDFADEEVRAFTGNSPLLWEFDERMSDCKTRDEAAGLLERILGNVRQILDEPAVRAGSNKNAA